LCSLARPDVSANALAANFHPDTLSEAVPESNNAKIILELGRAFQQRVWQAQLFADPETIEFLSTEDIIFTTWRELSRSNPLSKAESPSWALPF